MAISYSAVAHTQTELGNLIAQNYGEHIVSLKITEDTDNGRIVKVGAMTALDEYAVDTATTIGATIYGKMASGLWLVVVTSVADDLTALIYQKPLIDEESPRSLTLLKNFYNAASDGPVRGYILHPLDRFYLSEDGFSGTPAAGKTITSISDGKLVVA